MNLAEIPREFKSIPLGLVDAPALPSRSTMDEAALEELAASIRAIGLQQPLILARVGARFEVIAGHRRLLACTRAGLVDAPAIIYPSRSDALEAIKYAENRHREELSPADEAIWFSELLERDCGGDVDALCARLHEKRGYVEGRLLLFKGDPVVFDALHRGDIRIGIAHELNKIGDEATRRYYLDAAIRGGATVTVVASWVAQWKSTQSAAGPAPDAAPPPAPTAAVPDTNYFTCICCGGTENVHHMRPVNVHDYCKIAILDKLIAAYRGASA